MTDGTRRAFLGSGMAGLLTAVSTGRDFGTPARPGSFHFDHVIGTSFDGWTSGDSDRVAEVTLTEIDRLNRVFSLHDPMSELSRWNESGDWPTSEDFYSVRDLTADWTHRTNGALSPSVIAFQRIWNDAERQNRLPSELEIASSRKFGERMPMNLNAVAKGYILQRAATVAKTNSASGLLDLGGDMAAWGTQRFAVGIADPFAPFENARPLTAVSLANGSLATSGSYFRGYSVGGTHHSHIIDPRTGRPTDHVVQATVLAPESTTANALATALCVLGPVDGLHLIELIPNTECLIVTKDGEVVRSRGFRNRELPIEPETIVAAHLADSWPADFQVTVSLELPKITGGGRYRRPYVAVWIENADKKVVRTVGVWGNAPRWLPELTGWWKLAKDDKDFVKAVTKATRNPGKYEMVWDGKDDQGNALPRGTYTVKVEVHREHGKHLFQTGSIDCQAEAASTTMEKNAESEAITVKYGKKPDPKLDSKPDPKPSGEKKL